MVNFRFLFVVMLSFVLIPAVRASADSLSVSAAVSEALSSSPALQKTQAKQTEARWKKVEALNGFLPSLSLSAQRFLDYKYALFDIQFPGSSTMQTIPQIMPISDMSLSAQLPVFDGFASTNRLEAAIDGQRAADHQLAWGRFRLERQVTLKFFEALGAQKLKDVAEQNLKTLQDHLKDIRLFHKAGVSTRYDVLRVEVQVSEAESALLSAKDNIDLSLNSLAVAMGRPSESRALAGDLPVLKPELIQALQSDSLSEREDIEALRETTESLRHSEVASGRFWVPHVFLFGRLEHYNNRNYSWRDADFRDAYFTGVSLTWNVFDGMSSIAKAHQAAARRMQTEKTLEEATLHARQGIDLWRRKYLYNCSVYQARVSDVAKAKESVRLAREGRKVGSITNTDLLDAETELNRAQAGVVKAQVGAVEALINLELVTGQKLYSFIQ